MTLDRPTRPVVQAQAAVEVGATEFAVRAAGPGAAVGGDRACLRVGMLARGRSPASRPGSPLRANVVM